MCHFLKQFLDATKHKGTLHFVQYTDVFTLRPESLHRAQTLLPLLASDPKYSGQHSSTAALADAGRSEACDVMQAGLGQLRCWKVQPAQIQVSLEILSG